MSEWQRGIAPSDHDTGRRIEVQFAEAFIIGELNCSLYVDDDDATWEYWDVITDRGRSIGLEDCTRWRFLDS